MNVCSLVFQRDERSVSDKCHYAECHYAECHYAECHRAVTLLFFQVGLNDSGEYRCGSDLTGEAFVRVPML
jgi:hypothetical protein